MKTKLISILLVLAMLVPTLTACGNDGPAETEPDTSVNEEITGALPLVTDGVSDYVIVRGENASLTEVTASAELQSYLRQITGAELPVVTDATPAVEKEIVVGRTNREAEGAFDRNELGTDGFVIKTDDSKLWLVGGEQRGTLYAVYTFLEDYLNCRFYTADFEKIPETATISLKIAEDKQLPVFEDRSPYCFSFYSYSAFNTKRKVNGSCTGQIPAEYGGNIYSWAGRACHTLPILAEVGGGGEPDPCLSDENVYNTVLKNFRAILETNPTAKYASISQGDIMGACTCDACTASLEQYGYSGHYLNFVNRIANEVKDEYPDLLIHTFGYWFTVTPPKGGVVPADNVLVQICNIEACLGHPMTECSCIYPLLSGDYLPDDVDFVEIFDGWDAITDNLGVWYYITNFNDFNSPNPNFEAMRQNIRFMADHGVSYIFCQGNMQGYGGEFEDLRAYLLTRLLWDPYMSEEEYYGYMDEFLADFYGPGWVSIRAYIDYCEENCAIHLKTWYTTEALFPTVIDKKTNADRELPVLTADQLRNYKDVDWYQYDNYLDIVTLHEFVEKAPAFFEEALIKAETDEQRFQITKASVQVDYTNSYAYYYQKEARIKTLKKIFNNAVRLCVSDGSLSNDESSALIGSFTDDILDALDEEYYNYNKALAEKIIEYGTLAWSDGTAVTEDFLRNQANFYKVPDGLTDWESINWKDYIS